MAESDPKISETFCVLPWTHLFVGNMGDFSSCCLSYSENDPFKNSENKAIHFQHKNSISEAWNSSTIKKIRQEMLRGEKPAACKGCFQREASGFPSVRQSKNSRRKKLFPALLEQASPDGSAPMKLLSVDIRLGNDCNLKCRMCYPKASLPMAIEWKKLGWIHQKDFNEVEDLSWYKHDENWNEIFEAPLLDTIEFAGGEPLQNPKFLWALDQLIASGRAKQLKLALTSNLTFLSDELLKKFSEFKSMRGLISIDGTKEVNSYIRFPSSWQKFESNLKNLNEACLGRDWEFRFHTTVQAYNIENLKDLILYSLSYPNFKSIEFSFLSTPNYFSALVLPREYLSKIAIDLTKLRDSLSNSKMESKELILLQTKIEEVIQFLQSEPQDENFEEFISRTSKIDSIRGQEIGIAIPGLAEFFRQKSKIATQA